MAGYTESTAATTGNNVVWQVWTSTASTGRMTMDVGTASNAAVWQVWNANATTASTTITATDGIAVWGQWAEMQATQAANFINRQAQLAVSTQQASEYAKREKEAKQRAERLLLDSLTPEQREDLEKKKCFYLHLPSGKKYRIGRGTHGNVFLLNEKDEPVRRFCAQPAGVPVDDAVLAQKLALEADEEAFLRVANATDLRAGAA